jgi:DoxX-like family
MMSRGRQIAGWVLTEFLMAIFVGSAIMKLIRAPQVVEMLDQWGLGNDVLLIGVGELASVLLFLIPRIHSLSVLLLSGYMGGAIVTHMQHGESYVAQSIILLLIWIAGYLRFPEILQSFWATPSTVKAIL